MTKRWLLMCMAIIGMSAGAHGATTDRDDALAAQILSAVSTMADRVVVNRAGVEPATIETRLAGKRLSLTIEVSAEAK